MRHQCHTEEPESVTENHRMDLIGGGLVFFVRCLGKFPVHRCLYLRLGTCVLWFLRPDSSHTSGFFAMVAAYAQTKILSGESVLLADSRHHGLCHAGGL